MAERLAALKAGKSYDFSFNSEPKCPHCGSDFDISENEAWRVYDENDSHDVECPSCEQEFRINSIAIWHFSTDEQDE